MRAYARSLAFSILVLFILSAACAPASACMASCTYSESAGRYDRIFSGLILSTERVSEPTVEGAAPAAASPDSAALRDLRFWTKSRILVLHVWRGEPPTVAEVWTPGGSSCDLPMIAGFHFVALARVENGRSTAFHTDCEGDLNLEATLGRGTYTTAGVAIIAATICVAAFILAWSGLAIRRLRRSDRAGGRLPSSLCFVAAMLTLAPVIYLILFQSVVGAMISLAILLVWSKILAHLAAVDFWKRNAGWLLANAAGVLSIFLIHARVDRSFEAVSLIYTLTSSGVWIYVAVESMLIFTLLTALKTIERRQS